MSISRMTVAILTLMSAFLAGCAPSAWNAAERARDSGDTAEAVRLAVRTLIEEPGYEDALAFLQSTIPQSYDEYARRAERAGASGDWDRAYELYEDVEKMSDAIGSLPLQVDEETGEEIVFDTRDVLTKLLEARDMAADMHYTDGLRHEEQGDSKSAAKAFARAMSYIRDFKDARARYQSNRLEAVQQVAVLPFKSLTGRRVYRGTGAMIADRIILEAMRNPANLEFMEMVSRDNIEQVVEEVRFGQSGYVDPQSAAEVGRILGVDAFIVGSITSVSTDYPPDVVERYEERDEVSQGKNRPKRRVSATVTVVRREAIANVACTYQIIDVKTGKILSTGESEGGVVFSTAFGRYRGDKEALSHRSRQLCAVRETYPPADDEMVRQAAEDVARDLAGQVAGYFR